MKITILGTATSQGIPVIGCDCVVCQSDNPKDTRLRTSILISHQNKNIVVDVGPDFRQQMLKAKVENIHAVLLTHEHNDHIIGVDDVRPLNFRHNKNMPIYATKQVQADLKNRFAYVFAENPYPGAPRLELHTIDKDTPFEVENIPIIPIETMHGSLPVLGFRFGDFTYLTDAKTFTDKELAKIKGTKVLILSALHRESHHSHLSLSEALELIAILKPGQAYLTHLSHKMGLAVAVEKLLPKGVNLAYDGLTINF